MAVPTGTFQTYQAVGNREDLSDVIWDIDPDDTPFVSMMSREKVKARTHEWQTDSIAVPATNAQIEGDDVATLTAVPSVRLNNRVQQLAKVVRVADIQRIVDKAGRDDELEYQVEKRMREIKTDLEFSCMTNQASTTGAAGAAGQMAGAESWISTNSTSVGTGTAQTTPGFAAGAVAAPTDSTVTGTLTEAVVKSEIAAAYTAGGNPDILMVGPATKQKISGAFNGIATRFLDTPPKGKASIMAGADWYVSDFGRHKIVPNRQVARAASSRDRNIWGFDMNYWALGTLYDFKIENLAKTGLSDRKQISGAFTLISRNEKANFKVADINPAL